MDAESKRIIETYFKEPGLLPLADPRCFENVPVYVWKDIEKQIENYNTKTFIPGVFYTLYDLVTSSKLLSKNEVYELFLHPQTLQTDKISDSDFFLKTLIGTQYEKGLTETPAVRDLKTASFLKLSKAYENQNYDDEALRFVEKFMGVLKEQPVLFTNLFLWMTDVLTLFLNKNKFGKRAKDAISVKKSDFSYQKRKFLRLAYKSYDAEISRKFFRENPIGIDYPSVLMLDRVSIMVYSSDFFSFREDVRNVISQNTVAEETTIERLMFDKLKMIDEGYSTEEIDSLLPEDIDEKFSFMEHRSILKGFKLQRKPKVYRDGSGHMLLWYTDGATYRFRFDPPGGAPVSLAGMYNVQRIVYDMLIQNNPEIEKAYNEELIAETNFIPIGYEAEYLRYERQVIEDLKNKTVEFFIDNVIEKLKLDEEDVLKADIKIYINQIEICWNQPLPFDAFGYLHKKTEFFVRKGLQDTTLHGETPLMVSKIYSDIEPNQPRIAFKNYKKTKRIMRNELILGNELKTPGLIGIETLSDLFFRDVDEAKRFVYSKFILQFLRNTEGLDETEYSHGYNRFLQLKMDDDEWKIGVLQYIVEKSDIPPEFQDLKFFDVFTDQVLNSPGYVKRSFFRFLSDKKYERLVVTSDDFERRGRGKYRLNEKSHLFKVACEYQKIRNLTVVDDKNALDEIYHADNRLLKADLS